MQELTTLLISHNHLKTAEDIRHVVELPSLQTLDLQSNRLDEEDPEALLSVLAGLPNLRVLYLQGNPVVNRIRHYRKTLVSRCPSLMYLDDRPVFPDERSRCSAWAKGLAEGGEKAALEAEREEIRRLREVKRLEDEANFLAFERMIKEGLEARRRRQEDGDGEGEGDDGVNPFSGEPIVPAQDCELVRQAREEANERLINNDNIIFSDADADLPPPPARAPPRPPSPRTEA
jgi:dynein assembly factor 1